MECFRRTKSLDTGKAPNEEADGDQQKRVRQKAVDPQSCNNQRIIPAEMACVVRDSLARGAS